LQQRFPIDEPLVALITTTSFRRNQTAAVHELGAAQQKEKEKEDETQT